MFQKIKFLKEDYSYIKTYIDIMRNQLDRIMKEQTNLRLNYDNYFSLMSKTVSLLERICTAHIQYKKIKSGENLYIKALYG